MNKIIGALIKVSRKITSHIGQCLLAGLLVLVPIFITYSILKFGFEIVDNILKPLLALLPFLTKNTHGVGTAALLLLAYLLGVISLYALGKRAIKYAELLAYRIPVFGSVYQVVYPAVKTVMPSVDGKETMVGKVVCVAFRELENMKAIGLLMKILPLEEECDDGIGSKIEYCGIVYFASSPNPTTGQIIILPLRALRDVEVAFLPKEKAIERFMTIKEFKKATKQLMGAETLSAGIVSLGTKMPDGMKLRIKGPIDPLCKIPAS